MPYGFYTRVKEGCTRFLNPEKMEFECFGVFFLFQRKHYRSKLGKRAQTKSLDSSNRFLAVRVSADAKNVKKKWACCGNDLLVTHTEADISGLKVIIHISTAL